MTGAGAATYDVVVVGAGIVGACCAFELARAGLSVCVVDRGGVASGTTGAGEGNILVSDKAAGPELELALLSRQLWFELLDVLPRTVELETKGGVIVTGTERGLGSLAALSRRTPITSVRLRNAAPRSRASRTRCAAASIGCTCMSCG